MFEKIKNYLYTVPFLFFNNLVFAAEAGCTYAGITWVNGKPQIMTNKANCSDYNSGTSFGSKMTEGYNTFKTIFDIVYVAAVVLAAISLVYGGVELASSAGNQQNKQKAWGRIKISFIVLAALGGLGTVVKIAVGILR